MSSAEYTYYTIKSIKNQLCISNHRTLGFSIKNPPKWTENQIWQPQLDDFRTLLLRDYDEIVRNINELSEWIENNKG